MLSAFAHHAPAHTLSVNIYIAGAVIAVCICTVFYLYFRKKNTRK